MNCRGTALLMALVLLFGLSLLALSGTSGMILQKHMAINFQHRAASLKLAELAQYHARAWLFRQPGTAREANCVDNCLLPIQVHSNRSLSDTAEFESVTWWANHAVSSGTHPETREPYMDALEIGGSSHWLIEEISFQTRSDTTDNLEIYGIGWYRILSLGALINTGNRSVVEGIVARPWGPGIEQVDYPPEASTQSFCNQFIGSEEPQINCGQVSWRQLQ